MKYRGRFDAKSEQIRRVLALSDAKAEVVRLAEVWRKADEANSRVGHALDDSPNAALDDLATAVDALRKLRETHEREGTQP